MDGRAERNLLPASISRCPGAGGRRRPPYASPGQRKGASMHMKNLNMGLTGCLLLLAAASRPAEAQIPGAELNTRVLLLDEVQSTDSPGERPPHLFRGRVLPPPAGSPHPERLS